MARAARKRARCLDGEGSLKLGPRRSWANVINNFRSYIFFLELLAFLVGVEIYQDPDPFQVLLYESIIHHQDLNMECIAGEQADPNWSSLQSDFFFCTNRIILCLIFGAAI
jgi:hypothetical protein